MIVQTQMIFLLQVEDMEHGGLVVECLTVGQDIRMPLMLGCVLQQDIFYKFSNFEVKVCKKKKLYQIRKDA